MSTISFPKKQMIARMMGKVKDLFAVDGSEHQKSPCEIQGEFFTKVEINHAKSSSYTNIGHICN